MNTKKKKKRNTIKQNTWSYSNSHHMHMFGSWIGHGQTIQASDLIYKGEGITH